MPWCYNPHAREMRPKSVSQLYVACMLLCFRTATTISYACFITPPALLLSLNTPHNSSSLVLAWKEKKKRSRLCENAGGEDDSISHMGKPEGRKGMTQTGRRTCCLSKKMSKLCGYAGGGNNPRGDAASPGPGQGGKAAHLTGNAVM